MDDQQKLMEKLTKYDQETKNRLLTLIPYFHGVFARTKNPDALEVAKSLGVAIKETKN